MNLIKKRLKKIWRKKLATLSNFDSSDVIEQGYFLDSAISDECYDNWEKLENYINSLSNKQKENILKYNESNGISNEDDIVKICADIIDNVDANELPKELKSIVSKLENFNYICFNDVQNCACAFSDKELKIIQNFDNNQDKIISDIKQLTQGLGWGQRDEIIRKYIIDNYTDYAKVMNGPDYKEGLFDTEIDCIETALDK